MSFIPEFFYAFQYLKPDHKKLIALGGVVGLSALALAVVGLSSFSSKDKPTDNWVVESTLEETTVPAKVAPPFVKGEETRVVARYYTVGSEKKLWYLKKYPDAEKASLEAAAKGADRLNIDMIKQAEKKAMVRLPTAGSPWVLADSDAGRKITVLPVQPGVEAHPAFATVGD